MSVLCAAEEKKKCTCRENQAHKNSEGPITVKILIEFTQEVLYGEKAKDTVVYMLAYKINQCGLASCKHRMHTVPHKTCH